MRRVVWPAIASVVMASRPKMFAIQSAAKPCASTRAALSSSPSRDDSGPCVAPAMMPIRMSRYLPSVWFDRGSARRGLDPSVPCLALGRRSFSHEGRALADRDFLVALVEAAVLERHQAGVGARFAVALLDHGGGG